ncbi:MAG TPA: DNA polymerase III subunit alpha, partial [Blastocatellia bacterium]|nr:DNA polymerase III subunit alpha [Blastocatellia bacterium]
VKLVTLSHIEGFYYKPRMDKEILRKYHEGLICLSGCPASELGSALRENDIERGRKIVTEFIDIFGKENYFLEIMNHPEVDGHDNWKKHIRTLATEFDLPIVGTQDSHYLHKDDKEAHNTLVQINTGADGSGKGMKGIDGQYDFIDPKTAQDFFADMPGAVENTVKVADMCNLELTIGKFIFPEFKLPPGKTADEVLEELALKGLTERGLGKSEAAKERLMYELGIIKFKGYAAYFLVVEDLIREASKRGIYTNIRGSVAGSMTTYSLGITKVDPLEYKIPFERFLNPERPSAPDIDMDFADLRRDEIIEYAKEVYGHDKVAQIGTFGTMMARGAVRDVARALGYPYNVGDTISKLIPMGSQGFPMTIEHALEITPELKAKYDTERETKEILDLARKIEGSARHISVHAAGVVIAPEPLTEYVPLQFDPKGGKLITQYDMYSVGEDGVGLTKFDFLGIRNLTILAEAVNLVDTLYGKQIDIEAIPLDDKRTFEMLSRGET